MIEVVYPPLEALEASARTGDRQTFALIAERVDWAIRPPNELARAIDLALELELATLAMKLAQQGGRWFPEHERLQQPREFWPLLSSSARTLHKAPDFASRVCGCARMPPSIVVNGWRCERASCLGQPSH